MIKFFKNFRKDESGAVTVDWVVLTAAVAAMAAAVYGAVETGASSLADSTSSYLGTKGPSD